MRALVYRLVTGLETAAVLLGLFTGLQTSSRQAQIPLSSRRTARTRDDEPHVIPTEATPCGAERRDLDVRALVYVPAMDSETATAMIGLFTGLQTGSRHTHIPLSSRIKTLHT